MPLFRNVEGLSQRFNECVGLLQPDCFSLVMNMTLLRTRIIVIALMAGFAWNEGRAAGFLAGEEVGKAFNGMRNHEVRMGPPALLTPPGSAGINITITSE
jgi:hypothetical protein